MTKITIHSLTQIATSRLLKDQVQVRIASNDVFFHDFLSGTTTGINRAAKEGEANTSLGGATIGVGQTTSGGNGNNTLVGGTNDDTLLGLGGDDWLIGFSGNDVLDGGSGSDTAGYESTTGPVTINLRNGTASDGLGGTDRLVSIENLIGSAYSDSLSGDGGNNFIAGGNGSDTVFGDYGIDTLDGGAGFDWISYAGASSGFAINLRTGRLYDEIFYNVEGIIGTGFADTLSGNAGDNAFVGGLGNDVLSGGFGGDRFIYQNSAEANGDRILDFGIGDDLLDLSAWGPFGFIGSAAFNFSSGELRFANSVLEYDANGDGVADARLTLAGVNQLAEFGAPGLFRVIPLPYVIYGGDDRDIIYGSYESDTIYGGDGNDILVGLDGDDVLIGGFGADALEGAGGFDIISYTGTTQGLTIDLVVGNIFELEYFYNIEGIVGTEGNDRLLGDSGGNYLEGNRGNDTLTGRDGNDRFAFARGNGADVIEDFTQGDHIQLQNYASNNFAALNLTQMGADLLLDLGNGDTILIRNVSLQSLSQGDFIFL